MGQSSSQEASSFGDSQEFPRVVKSPNVKCLAQ